MGGIYGNMVSWSANTSPLGGICMEGRVQVRGNVETGGGNGSMPDAQVRSVQFLQYFQVLSR